MTLKLTVTKAPAQYSSQLVMHSSNYPNAALNNHVLSPVLEALNDIHSFKEFRIRSFGWLLWIWKRFSLESGKDRVPWEVVWWALRCFGVDEWIVSVIKDMYEDATTTVRVNGRESKAFSVRVGVHQGSVLSPLLFIIVLPRYFGWCIIISNMVDTVIMAWHKLPWLHPCTNFHLFCNGGKRMSHTEIMHIRWHSLSPWCGTMQFYLLHAYWPTVILGLVWSICWWLCVYLWLAGRTWINKKVESVRNAKIKAQ